MVLHIWACRKQLPITNPKYLKTEFSDSAYFKLSVQISAKKSSAI